MTKILIEIDPELQRVVPVEPTQEMIDAMQPVEEIGYWAMYESAIAVAPQPVDVDLAQHSVKPEESLAIAIEFIKNLATSSKLTGSGWQKRAQMVLVAMSQGEQK